MKEIIKERQSAAWVFFLSSILILAIVVGFKIFKNPIHSISGWLYPGNVLASMIAGGVTVQQGIAEFSGSPLHTVETGTLLKAFLSLLCTFIIGPVAFIYLRNRIKENKREGIGISTILRIGYGISYAWVVLLPAFIISATVVSFSIFSEMQNDNTLSQYRSDATQSLSEIVYKSQQYYILPISEGGGGKSFQKNGAPVTLEDLGFKEKTELGTYFLYRQKSDTTLYIHFFGNKPGTLTSGGFDPEIAHVVEYSGIIYPSSFRIKTLN